MDDDRYIYIIHTSVLKLSQFTTSANALFIRHGFNYLPITETYISILTCLSLGLATSRTRVTFIVGDSLSFHASTNRAAYYRMENDHRLAPIEKPFSKYPEFDQLRKMGLCHFPKLSKYLLKGLNKQGRICNKRILP